MGLSISFSFGQSGNKFEAPIRNPVWVLDDNNDLGITSMLPDVKSTLDTNSLDTPRKCWCTKEFLEFVKKLKLKDFNFENPNSVSYDFCGWKSHVYIKLTYHNFVEVFLFPRVLKLAKNYRSGPIRFHSIVKFHIVAFLILVSRLSLEHLF